MKKTKIYLDTSDKQADTIKANNKYDITKIDELHKLRADHYEETKNLSPAQQVAETNDRAKTLWESLKKLKKIPV